MAKVTDYSITVAKVTDYMYSGVFCSFANQPILLDVIAIFKAKIFTRYVILSFELMHCKMCNI